MTKDFIHERIRNLEKKFIKQLKDEDFQVRYSGLYSLLRLGQEPSDLEINDAIDKYI